MLRIPLYRFTRPDGGVTVSPVKPDTAYTELTRLVADEGCILTDGITTTTCVDTDKPAVWTEVSELSEVEEKAAAYDILMGVSQ